MTHLLPTLVCSECQSTNIIEDHSTGECLCAECGLVVSTTMINTGPEWRYFYDEKSQRLNRVGAPLKLTLPDKGLSTRISWEDKDASGKKINSEARARLRRVRRLHMRSISRANLKWSMADLQEYAYKLNIPKVVHEAAASVYRQALEKGLTKGRTTEGAISASIYIACRKHNVLRTIDEIVKVTRVEKRELKRIIRLYIREFVKRVPSVRTEQYLSAYVSRLGLSGNVEIIAKEVIGKASEKGLVMGKAPSSVASAALYIACLIAGERVSQNKIAETAQISEITVRNRYQDLVKKLNISISR